MRFEIRYPTGSPHQVDLEGTLVVLGRDPGCDLVISDPKCSRRHAVIEAVGQGLTIRDTGSANGVFVNGKRVERSSLEPDDLVRVGEVILKVLAEQITGTVVMGPDELEPGPPPPPPEAPKEPIHKPRATGEERPLPRPPSAAGPRSVPRPAPAPARRQGRPPEALRTAATPMAPDRPLTVTVLGWLWLVSVPLFLGSGITTAVRAGWSGLVPLLSAGLGIVLGVLGGVMGFGLLNLRPWVRILQIGLAGLGLLVCPFAMASATVLIYMLREDARLYFSGLPVPGREDSARATELTFSLSLLAMVALGVLLTALLGWLAGGRAIAF
jgi:Inner membrane component of T3SS, cytoplasmic domain